MTLQLERDGAQLFPQLLDPTAVGDLERLLPAANGPGERLFGNLRLAGWLADGPVGSVARTFLGEKASPVRAILFDKTTEANWALTWHQDRTIAVRQRVDVAGFDRWNRKSGANHVEPPFDLIERMLTARIHFDPVTEDNGPLLIAPGSHRFGRIEEMSIGDVVEECGSFTCLADIGDAWLYRTAILHASDRTAGNARRRVLQVDYSSDELPGGLEWLGVG